MNTVCGVNRGKFMSSKQVHKHTHTHTNILTLAGCSSLPGVPLFFQCPAVSLSGDEVAMETR